MKINLDDLVGTQRDIAEIIGIESYIKLCQTFGGDTIYIQKYSELQKLERNAEIKAKYNGYNSSQLAREYDLSERYVRIICSNGNIDGQLSILMIYNNEEKIGYSSSTGVRIYKVLLSYRLNDTLFFGVIYYEFCNRHLVALRSYYFGSYCDN